MDKAILKSIIKSYGSAMAQSAMFAEMYETRHNPNDKSLSDFWDNEAKRLERRIEQEMGR